MTGDDIADYNRDWLRAWTEKDVARLLSFYAPDAVYKDVQVPGGVSGHVSLGGYLRRLFEETPPMTYEPDETWAIDGGFCGRWHCTIGADTTDTELPGRLRGFDLVLLSGRLITYNEVYIHQLDTPE